MNGDPRTVWQLVTILAVTQLSISIFAAYSSSLDILSDGACLGGIFGSLANIALLAISILLFVVFGLKSLIHKSQRWAVAPFLTLALSSTLALAISSGAALRCTV